MSKHRIKSMAVDDDELFDDEDYDNDFGSEAGDGDGDGDGLTEHDREQLRMGTIEVRKQLGPEFDVTDNDIQESLWHYYYDIAKTVTYLKNKRTQSQKKTSQKGAAMTHATDFVHLLSPAPVCGLTKSPSFSTEDFFQDCPWLNVPIDRLAVFEPVRVPIRGGLLGGSSSEPKMSKLAALAAKRRQKENEKLAKTDVTEDSSNKSSYIASLEKLRLGSNTQKTVKPDPTQLLKENSSKLNHEKRTKPRAPSKHSPTPEPDIPTVQTELTTPTDLPPVIVSRAEPSAFARVLTGTTNFWPHLRQLPDSLLNRPFLSHKSPHTDTKPFDFTDPSPDDIVINAQKSKATKSAKSKTPAQQQDNLAQGVKQLSVSSQPVSKSKGIDVVSEYKKKTSKPAANFVVIGHVDAGKSTLMGRLLYDLKAIDSRTMEKYKKEAEKIGKGSFAFAWVLDQGSEERERGVTIDVATNKFETDKTSFTILDAPGHQDFVPNMIAGASQADFAVLVIDASTGRFESGLKGQTKEHALLARSLGVQRIIVAVNKMDAAHWSQDRFTDIQQQIAAFLISAGFKQQNLAFVPCSGLQGDNILQKSGDKNAAWYQGGTLVQELDQSEPTTHAIDKPLRMPIADVFRGGIQNPLSISGRIESGSVQNGEVIKIMPSGELAGIKGIEVDNEPAEWAVAGQNVNLHLVDIDPIHLRSGDVVCSQKSPITNIDTFSAKILAFQHLMPMHLDIHRGRLHVAGRISQLVATLDKSTGAVIKKKPKVIQPGSLVQVQVELTRSVPLEAPARIVMRSEGHTIAAGIMQ